MKHIVTIQFNEDQPKYRQIADHIESLIDAGTLLPGERLPAIRTLAKSLLINPVTVVKAYELLEQRSLANSKQGSGVYIRTAHKPVQSSNSDELYQDREITLMRGGSIEIREPVINFATSTPTSDLFPVESLKQAINLVIDRDGGRAFEYDESMGFLPLRQSLSSLLETRYGITAQADSIHIISGAQQGIDILSKALLQPGDTVLVEDPTYTGALAVFASRGARTIAVRLENDGPDLEELKLSLETHHPKLFYMMPDFQNPTGITCSTAKREQIIELVSTYGCYVIEDDYLSDIRFEGAGDFKPLKALERKHQYVIYLKSFSKVMMPGLRIGFIIAPEKLSAPILQAKHITDIFSSGLIQRTFDAYLRHNAWPQHLEMIRSLYKKRMDRLLATCEQQLSDLGVTWSPPGGGLSLWIRLPSNVSSLDLYKQAAARGVLITPGEVFRSGLSRHDDHFRLSIASTSTQDIIIGVTTLSEVIRELMQHRRSSSVLHPMM
jgi:DNA-binding transcriptional MocR family regulator